MTAIRSVRPAQGRFVQISNAAAQDRRLSLRARGILLFILSLPPDHHFTSEWLGTQVLEGRDAIRSALRELETCGYYRRTRRSNGRGQWTWEQVISDSPLTEPAGPGDEIRKSTIRRPARRARPAKAAVPAKLNSPHIGRSTLYRGIRMRSRLEASYAAHLDATIGPDKWEYEPVCFAGPDGQWLPDFRVDEPEGHAYVELKPLILRQSPAEDIDKILCQMSVALLSDPQCILRLQFWDWEASTGDVVTLGADGHWSATSAASPT